MEYARHRARLSGAAVLAIADSFRTGENYSLPVSQEFLEAFDWRKIRYSKTTSVRGCYVNVTDLDATGLSSYMRCIHSIVRICERNS